MKNTKKYTIQKQQSVYASSLAPVLILMPVPRIEKHNLFVFVLHDALTKAIDKKPE